MDSKALIVVGKLEFVPIIQNLGFDYQEFSDENRIKVLGSLKKPDDLAVAACCIPDGCLETVISQRHEITRHGLEVFVLNLDDGCKTFEDLEKLATSVIARIISVSPLPLVKDFKLLEESILSSPPKVLFEENKHLPKERKYFIPREQRSSKGGYSGRKHFSRRIMRRGIGSNFEPIFFNHPQAPSFPAEVGIAFCKSGRGCSPFLSPCPALAGKRVSWVIYYHFLPRNLTKKYFWLILYVLRKLYNIIKTKMIKKQELNEDLRVQHGDVYKKFFCEHNLVFSTNNVIDWGIGIGESFNNFKIKQKVSTKTYCGVKFNQTGKVYLNKIYEYDGLDNSFVVTNFDDTVVDYSPIQKFLDENYTAVGNKGIELSFICENPRGHGFGAGDVVSLLAVFAMMYTEGTITSDILKNYDEFLKSDVAQELHHKARSLADILMEGRSTGSDIYVSMSNESMPTVYVSKNIANKHLYENEKDKDMTIHKNIFDFLGIKDYEQELPFDFGVFYFGVDYDTDYVDQVSQIYKKDINEVQTYIYDKFKSNGVVDDNFYFGDLDYETFYNNFVEVGIILHFKLLKAFDEVLNSPLDENKIDKFIKIMNEFGAFSIIVESNNTFIPDIKNTFSSLKLFDNEKIGICPLTLGKMGGSFLFVTPFKKSRRTIAKMVEKYNFTGNKMHLEYASWIDGYSDEGIIVNQDLSQDIFSEYLQSGSVLYKDNFGKNYIGDYSAIIEKESKGILLDCIEGKIYINGKDLTSKDLVSQSSTVEILDYLISNMGQTVSSKDLPYSSYSTQRNQMAGKIILPLKKLTKKYFGKEIDLDCAGGLGGFNLTLDEKEIKIGVVKNV